MKIGRFCELLFVFGAVCFFLTADEAAAQESASSASVARSRAIAGANARSSASPVYGGRSYEPVRVFTPPDEVAVEEFVNYHRHRLPLPKAGQAVAMDVRFGNDRYSTVDRRSVLQIGFTTANFGERADLRPLNLALVIDKSGSMADGDKMSRVKQSLHTMVGKLRPDDIVSIVVFDTDAEVLYPSARIGNGDDLRRAIDCIQPNGSTNLHAGLMLGYKEAGKNFQKDATNRVILLTDGIANVGVTQPSRIAAESSEFNDQGIDLSTVGVGLDLNNDLLRTLARSGRGLYHFVSDYRDIEKVFSNEVQSLISSVAKRVEVAVEPAAGMEIDRVYGYSPKRSGNAVSIPLDDMNNGLTQVVLMDLKIRAGVGNSLPVKVRLTYFDSQRKRRAEQVQEISVAPSDGEHCNLLADPEVRKNHTIGELAQSLFEMKNAAEARNYGRAATLLDASVSETYRRYPNMEDGDVKFMLDIVEGYRRDLRAFNGGRSGDGCGDCR